MTQKIIFSNSWPFDDFNNNNSMINRWIININSDDLLMNFVVKTNK